MKMTLAEIKKAVRSSVIALIGLREAGFDGASKFMVVMGILAEFCRRTRINVPTGPLQKPWRFALEILHCDICVKCGDDFIVGFRISMDEYVTGGRTLEDTKTIVPYLEEAGASYINATAGVYRSFDAVIPSMFTAHAWTASLAKEIKDICNTGYFVGRYNDVHIANNVIASGKGPRGFWPSIADGPVPRRLRLRKVESTIFVLVSAVTMAASVI